MKTILIRIKQTEFTKKRIAHLFAEAFLNDPLYQYMFPKEENRLEILELFFKIYLNVYGKYGEIVTTSEDMTALAYVYYEERFQNKWSYRLDLLKASIEALDFLRYMSLEEFKITFKTIQIFSSTWIAHHVEGNYVHLDLLAVHSDCRGKGKASQLIGYVLREAQNQNLPITLETQNKTNVELYKHFGFEVVEQIDHNGLTQYCMVCKE